MKTGNVLFDFYANHLHYSLNSVLILFGIVIIVEINDRTLQSPLVPVFALIFILLFVLILINVGFFVDIKNGKLIRGTYKYYFNSFGVIFMDYFVILATVTISKVSSFIDYHFFSILMGSLVIGFTIFVTLGILSVVRD